MGELFAGKSLLIVYRFMLGAETSDPCKSCSFWAEHDDSIRAHLPHRDVTLICISRAPLAKISAVRARMGWRFPWISSGGSDFNADFGVPFTPDQSGQTHYNFGTIPARLGESPGLSVFLKQRADIFHTYSCYARGLEALNGTYQMLDLIPTARVTDSCRAPNRRRRRCGEPSGRRPRPAIEGIEMPYQRSRNSTAGMTPKGRDEAAPPWPMAWVKHKDSY